MESPVKRKKDSSRGRLKPESSNIEYINTQLKGKIKILATEMKDAVERMNSMSSEMNIILNENMLHKDRISALEQENAHLTSQIEEMINERAERDAIIDEFGTAVEARIIEWKEILDEKDITIAKLKENLLYASTDKIKNIMPNGKNQIEYDRLIQDINRRDEIIAELQSKLSEAVVEINESSLLLEKFKSDTKTKDTTKYNSRENREINKKIQDANKKINNLENLLERAERDAKLKSEQLCDALAMLNKYEDENASLTAALNEIKDLKVQIKKKGEHVEDLVDIINKLELENSRFEEVIIILRDKLGITEIEESSIEELILQRQEIQEEKMKEVERNYNQLSSENVDLKFQIKKLKSTIKDSLRKKHNETNRIISSEGENNEQLSSCLELNKEYVELNRIKENFKWIIEENEALRQGMHEILDCIHKQDAKSIITIQSQTLENLLEALDARHVSGWYHPAMRLLGRVNYLQGSNAELRSQLQQIRKNQILFQTKAELHAGGLEEGECSEQRHLSRNVTPDDKIDMQVTPMFSRNLTPKSTSSLLSQNADSGRASGKAEIDDIQQTQDFENAKSLETRNDVVMDDEEFRKTSQEFYVTKKKLIALESDFKKEMNDSIKHQKILENQIIILRKSLANFVSPEVYNELREKYIETNMRLRAAFEDKLIVNDTKGEIKDIDIARNKTTQELRDELISVHKLLSKLTINTSASKGNIDMKLVEKLENCITELKVENEMLKKSAEIAHEEALIHRAVDSTVVAEFNELRQQILKLKINEDRDIKEATRISLELTNYKVIETELREQKKLLENKILQMQKQLAEFQNQRENDKELSEQKKEQPDIGDYIEIIDFLQYQYAGSTSLSGWERYEADINKLKNDKNEVKKLTMDVKNQNDNLQIQYETLTNKLQIVEQLKDILEQQIGSDDVQDIMQKFTNETRQILSEAKYKQLISQLEQEVKVANLHVSDYEAKVESMERELSKVQKIWRVQKYSNVKQAMTADKIIETDIQLKESISLKQTKTKSTQTEIEVNSVDVQCTLCKSLTGVESVNKNDIDEMVKEADESEIDSIIQDCRYESSLKASEIALLQEQLGQALGFASERSIALSKCESQLAEYKSRNAALVKLLDEKRSAVTADQSELLEEVSKTEETQRNVATSHEALQSTINSLQKIVQQKEETIIRYQSLLKEDRDKHSEAASRLHEEIKSLRKQIAVSRSSARTEDEAMVANSKCPERDLSTGETMRSDGRMEEASILREKISRLETELNISAELAERWHRLAEDRLRHMDSTRKRLEDQHVEEIDSYRMELNKRQCEIDELRLQVSEIRRPLSTKTEDLYFMKTIQIKDNRLTDEIDNEDEEEHLAISSRPLSTMRDIEDSQVFEFEQPPKQLDNLRKQVQTLMEREKSYKNNIAELQQRLSRKYMAVKVQEKKASRREMQLERKVKELEKELSDAKEMLEHYFMVQQAKRVKTAEDLGLWEKLKKWQQTAEKLKEKLKEKSDECQRLQNNYEKLRNLISCIEREKWYLRGKFKNESITMPTWLPTSDVPQNRDMVVEDLQRECQELRDRVKELLDRLSRQDNEKNDENKISPSAPFQIEEYTNDELKRFTDIDEILDKENLRLETENFELRLELERANVNMPMYQEKIQHLEKYVELLKSQKPVDSQFLSAPPRREGTQRSKTELERTIIALKKLVEKLQLENKKLQQTTTGDLDFNCECHYLSEERERSNQRIAELEIELDYAKKRIRLLEEAALEKSDEDAIEEVSILRQQLNRKSELLMKVKDLLTKAALNEKNLRQRIQQLEFKQTLSIIPECGTSLSMI